jgi:hypothetical protein
MEVPLMIAEIVPRIISNRSHRLEYLKRDKKENV